MSMGCFEVAPQPFGLHYFPPAAELRPLVSTYYLFYADAPHISDLLRADLPQLRFLLSGDGYYRFDNDRTMRAPDVALIGPTMAATRIDVAGPAMVFGIGLLPAGWAALVRDDASGHADGLEDAGAVLGPLMRDAADAMRCTPRVGNMVSIADAVMRVLLARAVEPPYRFTRLVDRWLIGASSPEVDDLVARAGMSARQLERLTRRIYGAPPKLLARKYRALRAASRLGAADVRWQDVAGDAFYDQSHFIREVKQFTGQTPRQLQRDPTPLTRLTLRRRTLAGRLPDLALVT